MKKEKWVPKVGDRVLVSYISAVGNVCDRRATITDIKHTGAIAVEKDCIKGEIDFVHPRQCRRLVKRKRRSVWINPNDAAGSVERHSGVFYTGITFQDYSCNGWLEFHEVKRK